MAGRRSARPGTRSMLLATALAVATVGAVHAAPATEPKPAARLTDTDQDGVIRIGCLGDSNTAWKAGTRGWCELVVAALEKPNVEVLNLGQAGATAGPAAEQKASDQIDRAVVAHVDAMILAFGSEDLSPRWQKTPEEVVGAYQELTKKAEAAKIPVFVASIPPNVATPNGSIARTNDLLKKSFPDVIDFTSGFEKRDFDADGVQLNWIGQVKRANRAYVFLIGRLG